MILPCKPIVQTPNNAPLDPQCKTSPSERIPIPRLPPRPRNIPQPFPLLISPPMRISPLGFRQERDALAVDAVALDGVGEDILAVGFVLRVGSGVAEGLHPVVVPEAGEMLSLGCGETVEAGEARGGGRAGLEVARAEIGGGGPAVDWK